VNSTVLDDSLRKTTHRAETKQLQLFTFSGIVLLISCIQSSGLAAFAAEVRIKKWYQKSAQYRNIPEIVNLFIENTEIDICLLRRGVVEQWINGCKILPYCVEWWIFAVAGLVARWLL
jgi:hypothetical protein